MLLAVCNFVFCFFINFDGWGEEQEGFSKAVQAMLT